MGSVEAIAIGSAAPRPPRDRHDPRRMAGRLQEPHQIVAGDGGRHGVPQRVKVDPRLFHHGGVEHHGHRAGRCRSSPRTASPRRARSRASRASARRSRTRSGRWRRASRCSDFSSIAASSSALTRNSAPFLSRRNRFLVWPPGIWPRSARDCSTVNSGGCVTVRVRDAEPVEIGEQVVGGRGHGGDLCRLRRAMQTACGARGLRHVAAFARNPAAAAMRQRGGWAMVARQATLRREDVPARGRRDSPTLSRENGMSKLGLSTLVVALALAATPATGDRRPRHPVQGRSVRRAVRRRHREGLLQEGRHRHHRRDLRRGRRHLGAQRDRERPRLRRGVAGAGHHRDPAGPGHQDRQHRLAHARPVADRDAEFADQDHRRISRARSSASPIRARSAR